MNAERATVTFPSPREILVTRAFRASKSLVYEAWTKPELLRLWWAGDRGTVTIIEVDLRVGGRWRYAMTTLDGEEVALCGEYQEIVPEHRIVYTEAIDGEPGAEARTTVTFTEVDGETTVAILIRHASQRNREVHRRYMAKGLNEALDLLEHVLAEGDSA